MLYDLPFPPSSNTYYRQWRGRMLLSRRGREYRQEVADIVNGDRIEGRLAVYILLEPPTRRKFDIDNRIKPLLDALQYAKLFDDDEQVDEIKISRGDIVKDGRVLLQVTRRRK